MQMNSYGWITLIIICVAITSWVGSEVGYTVNGIPTDADALEFIGHLSFGKIDGMPWIFTMLFDCVPFLVVWIIYRQVRGISE